MAEPSAKVTSRPRLSRLDSLGARYLAFAMLAGVAVLAATLTLHLQVSERTARSAEGLAAAARVQRLTQQLRNRLWLADFRLNALLLSPERGRAEPVLETLEAARRTAAELAESRLEDEGAAKALPGVLEALTREVRRLLEMREDPARLYPALPVMDGEHLEANRRFATAVGTAIAALEAEGPPRDWELYRALVELRDLWRRTVLAFRGSLVLVTVFQYVPEDAERHEGNVRLLLQEVEARLAALARRVEGREVPLELEGALEEMHAALADWREGFERIIALRRSGRWRADVRLVATRIRPKVAEVFGHLDAIDRAAARLARREAAAVEAAARHASAMLWGFAIVGLVVVVLGYLYFERAVLRPVREMARLLRFGVREGEAYVAPEGGPLETRELAQAFQVMHQEVRRRQQALEHQALHDALTGLPNRVLMHDRLEQAIAMAERTRGGVALMLMDLDGFKEINDTLGHQAGDMILVRVAERLREVMRRADTVARLGGDEFAIVVHPASAEEAERVARKVLAALQRPVRVESHNLYVGASIGIALYPEHGADAHQLLRHADVAMYQAKRSGRGYAFYEEALDEHSVARLSLLGDLREAVQAGGLRLNYQPKVRIADGAVVGVEALLRWPHPERGTIPPEEFIPMAEKAGLMGSLTRWVLTEALAQCSRWRRHGLRLGVAVNLSAWNLHDPALPDLVHATLRGFGLPSGSLTLEVTESAAMSEPARVQEVLEELHRLGVRIAIDDFGTGFSSLAYLKQLPAHELKIDKSFVTDMCRDENDAVIVRSLIDLAHNLGREVVAEGVEDKDTWDILAILGCDYAQGFHVGRPMPAERLGPWLRRRAPAMAG